MWDYISQLYILARTLHEVQRITELEDDSLPSTTMETNTFDKELEMAGLPEDVQGLLSQLPKDFVQKMKKGKTPVPFKAEDAGKMMESLSGYLQTKTPNQLVSLLQNLSVVRQQHEAK